MTKILDSYGYPVNIKNLYLLDDNEILDLDVQTILQSDWYEFKGQLFVDMSKLPNNDYDFTPIKELGYSTQELKNTTFYYVDSCLRRYNPEDGFYHA